MNRRDAAEPEHPAAGRLPTQPAEPSSTWRTISATWLDLARQQNAEAWNRLDRLYRPMVCRWVRRYKPHAADADDLVQIVFLKAWQNVGRFRREKPGDSFRAWLWRITRNVLIDRFRIEGSQPQGTGKTAFLEILQAIPDDPPVEEVPCCSELGKRALHLLQNEFEERTWRAAYMAIVEDRSAAEIATLLNMTKAAVRQAKYRVLTRLRAELAQFEPMLEPDRSGGGTSAVT